MCALFVAVFIPDNHKMADDKTCKSNSTADAAAHVQSSSPLATPTSDMEDIEPLLQDSSM